MATYYEKTPPRFAVGEDVYTYDQVDQKWIEGEVLETGDESVLIQWKDIENPTEYQRSEMEMISHNMNRFFPISLSVPLP